MILNIVVDVILIAIVLIGAIVGIKKGFIKMAAKPVKFVAAIALAFAICSGVAESFITPLIEEPITTYVSEFLYDNCSNITAENAAEELPTLLKISAAIFNVDVSDVTNGVGGDVLGVIAEHLTTPVINIVSLIISFVIIYIIASIVFSIVLALINAIFSKGVFGVLNKFLGFVFTGAVAFIASWGLAVLFEFVIHLPMLESVELFNGFEGGFIYNFFNTYNPIELLLSF